MIRKVVGPSELVFFHNLFGHNTKVQVGRQSLNEGGSRHQMAQYFNGFSVVKLGPLELKDVSNFFAVSYEVNFIFVLSFACYGYLPPLTLCFEQPLFEIKYSLASLSKALPKKN